jgi:hypothetical protein
MDQSNGLSDREERLNEIIGGYLEAVHTGQTPDRKELLARPTTVFCPWRAKVQAMILPATPLPMIRF